MRRRVRRSRNVFWVAVLLGLAIASRPARIMAAERDARMTYDDLVNLARDAGFGVEAARIAAAIAMAESGGNATAVGDEGTSFGLWQVNQPAHPEYDASLLLDPEYNARAAFSISQGGVDFEPWTTFRTGAYRRYMPGVSA